MTDRGQVVAGLIDGRVAEGYRLARAILLDDDEAEDAVQDACLNAWLKRSSLRERDRFDVHTRVSQELFHITCYYKVCGMNDRPSGIPGRSQMLCKLLSVSSFRSSEITINKTEIELFAVEYFDGLAHRSADDAIGKPRNEALAAVG